MTTQTRTRAQKVTVEQFIGVWMAVKNREKAGEKLDGIAEVARLTGLTKSTVTQRASVIRGVVPTLPKFERKERTSASSGLSNVDAMLAIIAQASGQTIEQVKAENDRVLAVKAAKEAEQAARQEAMNRMEEAEKLAANQTAEPTSEVANSEPASEPAAETVSA